jgi:hypothetical protein
MPVFISYSHSDAFVVNKLAAHLVKHNANVWVDTWELNVGDSILNKVQDAIKGSSTLLVMLSKASVESEWCKKELSAGLMRELDEKRVVVLPVLVDDCEIPLFLIEKMYADLRTDFNKGLHDVLDAIAKVTNADQGRLEQDEGTVDWSEDWGYSDGLFHIRFTIVNSPATLPMTFLTQIYVFCNEVATSRYRRYEAEGLDWIGRAVIAEVLFDFGERDDFRVILDNQFPQKVEATIADPKTGSAYDVVCESRKMGQDNGKDQLLNISDYLKQIREYMRSVSRKPTPEEIEKIHKIMSRPWNA